VLGLVTVIAMACVVLVLGLVALLRADRKDIPAVVAAIGHWLRGSSRSG
jgi:hypothetical protein